MAFSLRIVINNWYFCNLLSEKNNFTHETLYFTIGRRPY